MQQRSLVAILAEWCAVIGAFMVVLSIRQPPNTIPAQPDYPKVAPDQAKRRPLLPLPHRDSEAGLQIVNGSDYQGTHIACDLPESLMLWNKGGSDGAGLCVPTSVEMAGLSQNVPGIGGFQRWCQKRPGGSYPTKLDKYLKDFYRETQKSEPPEYRQYEGRDIEAALDLISKTGRMAACTYGTSPRYGNRRIAHMVCSPLYQGKFCVILDNNQIGGVKEGSRYEWIDKAEGLRRICYPSGQGWVFVWLLPPPPPFLQPKG